MVLVVRPGMPSVTMAGRDDPGDARRLPADAPEDHGAVALDGAGRREAGLAGSRRPTRRSCGGRRSDSRMRSRRSWSAASRTSRRAGRGRNVLPGLVRTRAGMGHGYRGGRRTRMFSDSGSAEHRRDDGGARDDRERPARRAAAGAASPVAAGRRWRGRRRRLLGRSEGGGSGDGPVVMRGFRRSTFAASTVTRRNRRDRPDPGSPGSFVDSQATDRS